MSRLVFENDIRDTNAHTDQTPHGVDSAVGQIINGLDAEATVTVYGTNDGDSGSNQVQIGSATVSAGANASVDLSEPWDNVIVEAVATTAPTTGTLTVRSHRND